MPPTKAATIESNHETVIQVKGVPNWVSTWIPIIALLCAGIMAWSRVIFNQEIQTEKNASIERRLTSIEEKGDKRYEKTQDFQMKALRVLERVGTKVGVSTD